MNFELRIKWNFELIQCHLSHARPGIDGRC